jgi:hypothetical protein
MPLADFSRIFSAYVKRALISSVKRIPDLVSSTELPFVFTTMAV